MRYLSIVIFSLLLFSISNAQDIETDAAAYGVIPEFSNFQISPEGDKVAVLQNYKGQRILVIRSLIDKSLEPVGIPFADGEFSWVKWTSNERVIAGIRYAVEISEVAMRFNVRRRKSEFYTTRLFTMKWDGSDDRLLYRRIKNRRFQSQFQDNIIDMMMDDPEHVLLSLDDEVITEPTIYKLNVEDNSRSLVQPNKRDIKDWKADKNHIVRLGYASEDTQRAKKSIQFPYYRKSENDDWEKLYEVNSLLEEPPFEFLEFTPDPSVIYISQIADNGFKAVYKYNVDSREIIETVLESDEYDISDIEVDNNGEISSYSYGTASYNRNHIDVNEKRVGNIFSKNFPDSRYNIQSKSLDNKKMIVKTTSSIDPGTYYYVDLDKKLVEMIDYNYKAVDVNRMVTGKPITFKSSDGIDIKGYLSIPNTATDNEKLPTVIIPVWRLGERFYDGFFYLTQFLVSQGYTVLQLNYRGSGGYGTYYENLGKGELGRDVLRDVIESAHWLIDEGYTDPNKICLAGDTHGGYLALQAPIVAPDLFKCSIAHAPITHIDRYLTRMKDFLNFNTVKQTITNGAWDLDEASPLYNIDKMKIPVLVFHGEKDLTIPVNQGRDYAKRMKKAKKDITYVEFDDGDAFLSRQPHRIQYLSEMGKFLDKHLKN